jgi:uncharacterized protein (DUF305 family)
MMQHQMPMMQHQMPMMGGQSPGMMQRGMPMPGEQGQGMMAPEMPMMGDQRQGGMQHGMMTSSPAPGVTIIINMDGMPMMHERMMEMMGQRMSGMPGGEPGMGTEGGDPATTAFRTATAEMHRGMNVELTGDPDGDFARAMIPHHQGAIDMAKIALEYGKDPDIRKLAQNVIDAQEKEIAMLREWLTQHPQR